jgi:hypothetical protein
LRAGNTFKSIPTEPASLTFLEEMPRQKNSWVSSGSGSLPSE